MQFRMLGPLEIVSDGAQARQLNSPTQRALLAVLLIHRNQILSPDQIIHEIWGDDETRPAPRSLQFHMSKLRDALDPNRPRRFAGQIQTRQSGYVLEVAEGQVDAAVFERLVNDVGRKAMQDPAQRRASLEHALSMWRGRVLEGVPELGVTLIEARRLTELWLVAVEERIDADLALGRHAALVPELEVLTEQHPLRERLRGQLMLSLYRSDRQAESLRVFQTTREPSGTSWESTLPLRWTNSRIRFCNTTLPSISLAQRLVLVPTFRPSSAVS